MLRERPAYTALALLLARGFVGRAAAYTLKSALDGWIARETADQIRDRAASAYDKYQKCGFNAARRLFATGW